MRQILPRNPVSGHAGASQVYTTRLARGGRGRGDGAGNQFETLLADLGIADPYAGER